MGSSALTAGVGGAINRERALAETTNKTLNEAFSDLKALMEKAEDIVTLAKRFAESMDDNPTDESSELQQLVLTLGIKNPVTLSSAGAAEFHRELAKQLADWIQPLLAKSNGIITIIDAFCLFNRARGTELISPKDMLRACESWEGLGLDLHLRTFASGITVIHTTDRTDENAWALFRGVLTDFEHSLNSFDAARLLETSPEIALEYLCSAENAGLLCRDDGPAEIRFYANKFAD
jgi:ESCRT-II complex subunit VPS36